MSCRNSLRFYDFMILLFVTLERQIPQCIAKDSLEFNHKSVFYHNRAVITSHWDLSKVFC
jgi:hypothetical protein